MREMRSGTPASGEAFLRQLSVGGGGGGGYNSYSSSQCCNGKSRRGSKRWGGGTKGQKERRGTRGAWGQQDDGGGGGGCGMVAKKRVMVVIDQSAGAKQAMMWALTHVANKGDLLTLLHVVSPYRRGERDDVPNLANSLGSLCKACKPEVEVEALVIQGSKLATVLNQVRKLEASVLVLSQPKPSPFCCLFRNSSEEFVEQCIDRADCLTLAVRKQSKGTGGYLVSTRWQKNFWLLA